MLYFDFCARYSEAEIEALEKSDDNARMQMRVIGWDKDTQAFLLDALSRMQRDAKDSLKWNNAEWWK